MIDRDKIYQSICINDLVKWFVFENKYADYCMSKWDEWKPKLKELGVWEEVTDVAVKERRFIDKYVDLQKETSFVEIEFTDEDLTLLGCLKWVVEGMNDLDKWNKNIDEWEEGLNIQELGIEDLMAVSKDLRDLHEEFQLYADKLNGAIEVLKKELCIKGLVHSN